MTSVSHLEHLLFQKWKSGELGHFYIVNHPGDLIDRLLARIVEDQLKRAESNWRQHPDILILSPTGKSGGYSVDDIGPLFPFLNYAPLELPHRFILFQQASSIDDKHVSNKLLKILETPLGHATIFFLNDSGRSFIPTIESRAIKIRVPAMSPAVAKGYLSEEEWRGFLQIPLHEQLSRLKSDRELQEFLVKKTMAHAAAHPVADSSAPNKNDYLKKNILLEECQWFQRSAGYNNPETDRVISFLRYWEGTTQA